MNFEGELPGDYGRGEEAIERSSGNPNGDGELIGRKQPQHSRDGLLHRVLSGIRYAFGDDGAVKRLNPLEHVGDDGESAVEAGLPSGDELVGDADAGDEASERGGETTAALEGGEQGAGEEVAGKRRRWELAVAGVEGEVGDAGESESSSCGRHGTTGWTEPNLLLSF